METRRCIVCYLNFLNKAERRLKGDHYLMTIPLCPECRKKNTNSRFTMADALGDPSNKVHALTCTLSQRFHHVGIFQIVEAYKKIVETYIRNRRTPNYFEGYFEYTENGVLHMHAYVVGRKNIISPMYSAFRRFGHILIKECFDSEAWLQYAKKDLTEDSPSPIIVVT